MLIDLTISGLFDSKTLFTEMALLNTNAIEKATNAFQFIYDNGISGVMIGGMAVAHWTKDRKLTPDVDFLVSDMSKLINVLNKNNIYHTNLMLDYGYKGVMVQELDADFIDASSGNTELNQYILKTAHKTRIGGLSFNVVDPAVQVIMKFNIGRDKDTEDAFQLLQHAKIDKKSLKQHLQNLKNSLTGNITAKEIWSYAQTLISK